MKISNAGLLGQISSQVVVVERIIKKHLDNKSGILKLGFAPRLLETILLSSYFRLYHSSDHGKEHFQQLLERVKEETMNPSILPFIDLNLQDLLLTLHQNVQNRDMIPWFLLYNSLLQAIFQNDTIDNKRRKMLAFNIIALFSAPNQEMQKSILNQLAGFGAHVDDESSIFRKLESSLNNVQDDPPWHWLYHAIFYLLWVHLKRNFHGKRIDQMNPTLSGSLERILLQLQKLQDPDGVWQKNHLLTLLLLHVIRFSDLDKIFPERAVPMVARAESYLNNYLSSGLSVLPNQELYNTSLYFGLRFYFTGLPPPSTVINALLSAQHEDGGIKFHHDIIFSDFDTTGFAMMSMLPSWIETRDEMMENALKKCIKYMLQIRKEDGSFPLYAKAKESLPEMTARAIMVSSIVPPILMDDNVRFDIIASGIRNLVKQQDDDGTFKYNAYSASELYPISQASLALHFMDHSPFLDNSILTSERRTIKKRILAYLNRCQNNDGSYSAMPYHFQQGEQQSTSYAILSWASLDPGTRAHERALRWLLQHVENNVRSFPEGTGPRPIRYNDLSHGPIFAYLALASTLHSNEPQGIEVLKNIIF